MLSFFSYQISSNVPNFFLILFSSETKYFVGLKLLHILLNDSVKQWKHPRGVYCTRINTSTQTAELTCLREAAVALKRHAAAAALLDIFVLEQMWSSLLTGCSVARGPIFIDSAVVISGESTLQSPTLNRLRCVADTSHWLEAKAERGIIIADLIIFTLSTVHWLSLAV